MGCSSLALIQALLQHTASTWLYTFIMVETSQSHRKLINTCTRGTLKRNPQMDIADIRVYMFFQSEDGKKIIVNGWNGAGILHAVSDCRNMNWKSLLDPFAALSL